MVWAAVGSVAAAVVGGVMGSDASRKASNTQKDAANAATAAQQAQIDQAREDQAPWRTAGANALTKLELLSDYKDFGMDQFRQDPGYAFRLSEGTKALERSAAARGGLLSGSTLKGIQRYGQEMASNEYTNAFNRYQTERAARLQPLQSLAGLGQTSASQTAAQGQAGMNNITDLMTSGAAARASGYIGQSNALTGALSQGVNYYQNQQMINKLNTPTYDPSGGYGGYGGPMEPGE